MAKYKWIALSNTTLGVLMATINSTIVLISLPAIFRGISLNPLSNGTFQYLLWILFGFNIVTTTMLVTFGRLSDVFGRVRLFNAGFAVFTTASILLFLTPGTGTQGATELVLFRVIQGLGASLLLSNSAAILTDAFPASERGKALGINQVAALVGALLGLILGGILAAFDWRYVFLVSVPVGLIGTFWSYLKLKETAKINRRQGLDVWGNTTFGGGLTLLLIGVVYGLLPYGKSSMGWANPWVVASLLCGAVMLAAFPMIERRVKDPMFRLDLFKIRMFSAAGISSFLSSMGRGGVMIILIILLQGIWLPLHGYSFESTPFWAGVYMIPMLLGFVVVGPLSGWLSDRTGARVLSTLGMTITGASFLALSFLPYDFQFPLFAGLIFAMGMGGGMFAAPNTASLMNSVPPEHRGAASGMNATLQNTGQTVSIALFFTIIIVALTRSLPTALSGVMSQAGVPQLASYFSEIPATAALFAAFLGYNPVVAILSTVPSSVSGTIPSSVLTYLTGTSFFPHAIAPSFMAALDDSFYIGAGLSFIAAVVSALRGKIYIHEVAVGSSQTGQSPKLPVPQSTQTATSKVIRLDAGGENVPETRYAKIDPPRPLNETKK
jgi:MFS family permease